jgi:hypothetical protein
MLFIPPLTKRNNVPHITGALFRFWMITHSGGTDHLPHTFREIIMESKPVALVTGANQGIGLQIAKELAAHGYTVLVGSRNPRNGETAARDIGADAHGIQLDVTDPVSITAAAERVRTEFGRLDLLVNNAAISHAGAPGKTLEQVIQEGRADLAPSGYTPRVETPATSPRIAGRPTNPCRSGSPRSAAPPHMPIPTASQPGPPDFRHLPNVSR